MFSIQTQIFDHERASLTAGCPQLTTPIEPSIYVAKWKICKMSFISVNHCSCSGSVASISFCSSLCLEEILQLKMELVFNIFALTNGFLFEMFFSLFYFKANVLRIDRKGFHKGWCFVLRAVTKSCWYVILPRKKYQDLWVVFVHMLGVEGVYILCCISLTLELYMRPDEGRTVQWNLSIGHIWNAKFGCWIGIAPKEYIMNFTKDKVPVVKFFKVYNYGAGRIEC